MFSNSIWCHLAAVGVGGHLSDTILQLLGLVVTHSISLESLEDRHLRTPSFEEPFCCAKTGKLSEMPGPQAQSKSINASKILELALSTLQKLWRYPNATIYIHCILDHTAFHFDMLDAESMARQESNRIVVEKAATPSQRADPLIHKMGSSMALLWHCCNQRKSHLQMPPLHGSGR